MTEALARVAQAGLDIFRFKVCEFLPNLSRRKPSCQQLQDVNYPDAHSAHTRLSAAYLGVDRYSLSKFRHIDKDSTANLLGLTYWLSLWSDLGNQRLRRRTRKMDESLRMAKRWGLLSDDLR